MDTATGTVSRWRNHLREETNEFDDKRYSDGSGVAWWILGYEVEALVRVGCTGCDFLGYERDGGGGFTVEPHFTDCPDDAELIYDNEEPEYERTGNVLAVMVGDDRPFAFDLSDLKEISDDDYCSVCGQIGCHHNA